MNKYFFYIILIVFCFSNCTKNTETSSTKVKKSDNNIVVKHKTYTTVNASSLRKITTWKEYQLLDEFIKRYEKTSPDEAFDNINELKELTLALEDSLTIKTFKTPSFKSRLHVLENEVLRLQDMANIPAITPKEVNNQIDKIFLIYGSLNDKINTAFNQEKFEKDINLDDFFSMDEKELIEEKKTVKRKPKQDIKKKIKRNLPKPSK